MAHDYWYMTHDRKIMQYLFTFLKGLAMGAADIVPGVSGGTIAFITGIYERLLNAIKSVDLKALQVLIGQASLETEDVLDSKEANNQPTKGILAFWKHIDGTFLVALFLGILTSVFTLASLLSSALESYPQLLWSFFMGLIIASALYIGRQIKLSDPKVIIALVVGIAIAYTITLLSPTEAPKSYLMAFFAGAIAICAMILPGISGSFILLLMGMYGHVVGAIHDRDFVFLIIFAAGCGIGLLSFARLLSWLFKNFKSIALAVLTGFMIGSLPKVWPWQNVTQTRINSDGESVPFLYENVMPEYYDGNAMLTACVLLVVLGFVVVLLLEWLGGAKEEAK
jgi:putative membrane protein